MVDLPLSFAPVSNVKGDRSQEQQSRADLVNSNLWQATHSPPPARIVPTCMKHPHISGVSSIDYSLSKELPGPEMSPSKFCMWHHKQINIWEVTRHVGKACGTCWLYKDKTSLAKFITIAYTTHLWAAHRCSHKVLHLPWPGPYSGSTKQKGDDLSIPLTEVPHHGHSLALVVTCNWACDGMPAKMRKMLILSSPCSLNRALACLSIHINLYVQASQNIFTFQSI